MKIKKNKTQVEPAGPYSPWIPGMKPPKQPVSYVIEVLGCIGGDWSEWFNGLSIQCHEDKGISLIYGSIKDQAELFALLTKIRNLGLSLIRLYGNV